VELPAEQLAELPGRNAGHGGWQAIGLGAAMLLWPVCVLLLGQLAPGPVVPDPYLAPAATAAAAAPPTDAGLPTLPAKSSPKVFWEHVKIRTIIPPPADAVPRPTAGHH
jgi:hypothetical protein